MESWNAGVCKEKGADYFLLNKSRTLIKIHKRASTSIGAILSALEEVQFPLEFTEGLHLIHFRYMRRWYGQYGDNVIEVDVRSSHRLPVVLGTLVHEVAHHVDSEQDFSTLLHEERVRLGAKLHAEAADDDGEYFARGFEKFYSLDRSDRDRLRRNHPKLYRMIARLDKNFKQK